MPSERQLRYLGPPNYSSFNVIKKSLPLVCSDVSITCSEVGVMDTEIWRCYLATQTDKDLNLEVTCAPISCKALRYRQ